MNKSQLSLLAITALVIALLGNNVVSCESSTNHPVIGIYAQPSHFEGYSEQTKQYVLGANIEWVEMSGAKAVIIPFDQTEEYYKEIIRSINGLLFTGGNLNININAPLAYYSSSDGENLWTKNAAILIHEALTLFNNGTYFPVWGNCQGFQLLQYYVSNFNYTILNHITNDQNTLRTIQVLDGKSYFFDGLSNGLLGYAQEIPSSFYYHELGVTQADYLYNDALSFNFDIIATSVNATSTNATGAFPYISAIQGKRYPIFGLQFHPEYSVFESQAFVTNTSHESIAFNSFFSAKFIEAAKKNNQTFAADSKIKASVTLNPDLIHADSAIFSRIAFIDRTPQVTQQS